MKKKQLSNLDIILDNYQDQSFLLAEGFDNCIIGICFESESPRLIYSVKKIINQLINQGLDYSDALEHYEFNIAGAYVGKQTPIYSYDLFDS